MRKLQIQRMALFMLLSFIALTAHSQVTIGDGTPPQKYSVLEVVTTTTKGGLRLPQLTTQQRKDLTTSEFKADRHAKGLMIFNTDTNCVETWNGSQWISICAGMLSSLDCTSVTGISVTQGSPANITGLTLPYIKDNGELNLVDNQLLNTDGTVVNGLSVLVDGDQVLSAASGNINIKVTGTATVAGNITIPITLAGADCSITVTATAATGITAYDCSKVTGPTSTTIPSLAAINLNALKLAYTKTGGDINLTNNTALGTNVNGLTAQVRGNQTLTAASGTFDIKVTGTPLAFGTFDIPVTVNGSTCYIPVSIIQSGGDISSLDCASVTGVAVTQGAAVNIAKILPYSGKTGANISLADNTVLGSADGLSIQVDGAQTLSATNGNISIKVTGTATTTGTISIPITVGGASCNISVTSNAPYIGSIDCSAVTGLAVTQGVAAIVAKSLPYSGMVGSISLANDAVLGSASGLSVKVNGPQTLTAASGNINIYVTGTTTALGAISIPITVAGAECSISVTSNAPYIGNINCSSVTGLAVTQGVAAIVAKSLPYSGMVGSISLANDAVLGSASGLSVKVNGPQTLTAASGNINIYVTGTTTALGAISIPITVAGAECSISVTSNAPYIGNINCSSVTGVTVRQGVAAVVAKSLPYSGMVGSISLANDAVLGSASGLSVKVNGAQTLTAASGNINIYVTGTTTALGAISIPVTVAGASCNISITSDQVVFSPNYNVDSGTTILNTTGVFVGGTGDAKTRGTGVAHGNMSAGVFRYTNGKGEAFAGYTYTHASGVKITISARTLANGAGELPITVSGTVSASYAGKAFDVPVTVLGQSLYVRVSTGCGAYTSSVRTIPSTGGDPNWKQWQCFNLGANTTLANPFQYVVGNADGTGGTLGYLYQWGRPSDNHQLRNSGTTNTLATSNTPGHSNFIKTSSSPDDWRSGGGNTTRWGDGTQNENQPKAVNDPCPAGWKISSQKQWASIYTNMNTPNKWTWTGNGHKVGDALYLPAAGYRSIISAAMDRVGSYGYYWSSTVSSTSSYNLYFASGSATPADNYSRGGGFSVRCVAE